MGGSVDSPWVRMALDRIRRDGIFRSLLGEDAGPVMLTGPGMGEG